ncbi:MAG: NAD-dependent epimerase/dehydratase family protein [Gloeocapsa sp. DLM2.Bin57]|nr:MAG: NAD-dependent epimerase/dehydratase family protein [Gloeocapsa sp. DLM2.Bin57]
MAVERKPISQFLTSQWTGKRVLVTGASGFKGSWLCKTLLDLGAQVYATIPIHNVRHPHSAYQLFGLSQDVVEVSLDISDSQLVFDIINTVRPDVIFHLAAKAQVTIAQQDPRRAFMVNTMGTINLLEACRHLEIGEKILIISTDHVFGDGPIPKDGFVESSPVSYAGPYDTSKSMMELAVRCYHKTYSYQLPAIGITRAANVFGYGDTAPRRIIPQFINSAVKAPHKIFVKYPCNGRQFIYVNDIIAGYIRAASSLHEGDQKVRTLSYFSQDIEDSKPFTPTFHFALSDYDSYSENGETFIRISNLARMIKSIVSDVNSDWCKEEGVCNVEIDQEGNIDYAPNENPYQAMNCSDTFTRLNWKPQTSLEDGLKKMAQWFYILNKNDIFELKKLIEEESQNITKSLLN